MYFILYSLAGLLKQEALKIKMLLFNYESANCSAMEGTWDKSRQIPGVFWIDVEEARIEQWKSVVHHNKNQLKASRNGGRRHQSGEENSFDVFIIPCLIIITCVRYNMCMLYMLYINSFDVFIIPATVCLATPV